MILLIRLSPMVSQVGLSVNAWASSLPSSAVPFPSAFSDSLTVASSSFGAASPSQVGSRMSWTSWKSRLSAHQFCPRGCWARSPGIAAQPVLSLGAFWRHRCQTQAAYRVPAPAPSGPPQAPPTAISLLWQIYLSSSGAWSWSTHRNASALRTKTAPFDQFCHKCHIYGPTSGFQRWFGQKRGASPRQSRQKGCRRHPEQQGPALGTGWWSLLCVWASFARILQIRWAT